MLNLRHRRYSAFVFMLLLLAAILNLRLPFAAAFSVAFDISALGYILSSIPHWSEGAPQTIREQAARDVGGRSAIILLTLTIMGAILIAVGILVSNQEQSGRWGRELSLATLVLAWIFANLVMAYHYAHRFYDQESGGDDHGGLSFPGSNKPCFADFVNFAFVLGMTCQTADIAITRAPLRRITTLHGVAAFFFNLGVLAFAINLTATTL
jgi:uncharacterized membrane protein